MHHVHDLTRHIADLIVDVRDLIVDIADLIDEVRDMNDDVNDVMRDVIDPIDGTIAGDCRRSGGGGESRARPPPFAAARMTHPCLSCGACCATFRVAFHWSEADPALGGAVPAALTEPLDPHRLVMRGTRSLPSRCTALDAEIGVRAGCAIYPSRPSVCREVEAAWEHGRPSPQCDRARIAHGLAPLQPGDWAWREAANEGWPDDGDHDRDPPTPAPPLAA